MPHYIDDHGIPGIQAERMNRTNPPLGQHITNLDKALDNVTPADMYLGVLSASLTKFPLVAPMVVSITLLLDPSYNQSRGGHKSSSAHRRRPQSGGEGRLQGDVGEAKAGSTSSTRKWSAIAQPTIRREHMSSTAAR
jgi:hypothetical protein